MLIPQVRLCVTFERRDRLMANHVDLIWEIPVYLIPEGIGGKGCSSTNV